MTRTPDDEDDPGFSDIAALPPHGTQDRYLMLRWHIPRWREFAESAAKGDKVAADRIAKGCANAFTEYCNGKWIETGGTPSGKRDHFRNVEKRSKQLLEALVGQPINSREMVSDLTAAIPLHARLALTSMVVYDEIRDCGLHPAVRLMATEKIVGRGMTDISQNADPGSMFRENYDRVRATVDGIWDLWRWSSNIADGLDRAVTDSDSRNRRLISPIVRFRVKLVETFDNNKEAIAGGKGMAGEYSDMAGGPLDTFLESAEQFLCEAFGEPLPERSDTSAKHAYHAYRKTRSNQP